MKKLERDTIRTVGELFTENTKTNNVAIESYSMVKSVYFEG